MSERVLVWSDEAMVEHDPAHGRRFAHPERPERLQTLLELLDEPALAGALERRRPGPASREELLRVHGPEHVGRLLGLAGQDAQLDPDTALSPASIHAARLAAGSLVEAVEAVCAAPSSAPRRAMCLVRPPGHHAEPDRAMGFCLFDNIALAAAAARAAGHAERVLIVDWDVHHGNGTQAAFYERDDVLCFDLHQHPWFPGTGAGTERGRGPGEGFTVNCPLPAGLGDPEYLEIVDRLLPALAERFEPDLVLVSAGFDAHADDPLGGMELSAAGFAQLCARVRAIAERHAQGRLILTLEGGYELDGLRASVRACLEILAGAEAPRVEGRAASGTAELAAALATAAGLD